MTHSISSPRRPPVIGLLAVGLVAVLALLTGCDNSLRAGEAAAVDDTTISTSRVNTLLQDYLRESGQNVSDSQTLAQLRQALINNLLLDELTSVAARKVGVTVSAGTVSKQVQAQLGASNYADVAKQYVIPRSLLPDMIRASLERAAIGEKLAGVKATSAANAQKAQKAMSDYLVKLGHQEDVWVNPRFGTWDPSKLAVTGGGALVQTGSSTGNGS